jgi:hypothetical protein
VRVAVRKIQGVDSVRVSLNQAAATIWLRPQNTVTIGRLREAIRSNGFTPKAAAVRVTGRVVEADSGLGLTFGASGIDLSLADHPSAPGLLAQLGKAGANVVVLEGTIGETKPGEKRPTLQVQRLNRGDQ